MSTVEQDKAFEKWAKGYGVIQHNPETRQRIHRLLSAQASPLHALELLSAADRLCNMGMWLTVHMTYAKRVFLDGRTMQAEDFKVVPEGHTGGALNMVPAYVGYLLANALSGKTRSWMMGQGHCVAAIDAVNILVGNVEDEQDKRYPCNDDGLSTLCQDFYGYDMGADGRPAAPLGSHVNAYTAGGISEGGYLGFAELQYVHMPLPGQELVTFLSDGAFEEQRGSDWAPRWWRGEDTGLVMPMMIANGRRIDQRTTMEQSGGVDWFRKHLLLYGFDPIDIDGRDPAAFAWAILTMGNKLQKAFESIQAGNSAYPVKLPYAIAETIKGYGFAGAGTNASHNLPLPGSPQHDEHARQLFNDSARRLFVDQDTLQQAVACLCQHEKQGRAQEKDHPLRRLEIAQPKLPALDVLRVDGKVSPMAAIDEWFDHFIQLNPEHRFRIGNPDEMRSNRMNKTLDRLKHRVTAPEEGISEALLGSVVTALNEEAAVSAALANKQGISAAISYEAFAVKMLGAMRQEAIFSRHLSESGRPPQWISVPIIVTSHTWENGKNEQSHQDPCLSEAWMQEMEDVAPVYFPFDAMSAACTMAHVFASRGKVATVLASKNAMPVLSTAKQAKQALADGALLLQHDEKAKVQLIAIGSYQLQAAHRAASVLAKAGIACSLIAMVQPGRFRQPRDEREAAVVHRQEKIATIIPDSARRIIISHTHAEVITGVLRNLDTGPQSTRVLGYRNRGGTFDVLGMQYANRQTWAHIVAEVMDMLGMDLSQTLTEDECQALLSGDFIAALK